MLHTLHVTLCAGCNDCLESISTLYILGFKLSNFEGNAGEPLERGEYNLTVAKKGDDSDGT